MKTALGNYKIFNPETGVVKGNRNANYQFRVTIDGQLQKFTLPGNRLENPNMKDNSLAKPVYTFDGGNANSNSKYLAEAINHLAVGPHVIRIELWGGGGEMDGDSFTPIASGEFTLTKKGSTVLKLGLNFNSVKAAKTDKVLEADMLIKLNKSRLAMAEKSTYTAVKMTDSDWTIVRNRQGLITGRAISTMAVSKLPNGKCQMQQAIFLQQFDGTGYQSGVILKELDLYNIQEIDCN